MVVVRAPRRAADASTVDGHPRCDGPHCRHASIPVTTTARVLVDVAGLLPRSRLRGCVGPAPRSCGDSWPWLDCRDAAEALLGTAPGRVPDRARACSTLVTRTLRQAAKAMWEAKVLRILREAPGCRSRRSATRVAFAGSAVLDLALARREGCGRVRRFRALLDAPSVRRRQAMRRGDLVADGWIRLPRRRRRFIGDPERTFGPIAAARSPVMKVATCFRSETDRYRLGRGRGFG